MRSNIELEIGRERRLLDPGADLPAAGREGVDVFAVEALQLLVDALTELVGAEELAEGIGRGGEAARHADAGRGKRGAHFTQRGVFATDLREVCQPQIF